MKLKYLAVAAIVLVFAGSAFAQTLDKTNWTPDHDFVSDSQLASAEVDGVLTEVHLAIVLPVRGQSAERLDAPLRGQLVGGGDDTAGTGLHHVEWQAAYQDPGPPIFLKWLPAGESEIGTEPVHRQRLG